MNQIRVKKRLYHFYCEHMIRRLQKTLSTSKFLTKIRQLCESVAYRLAQIINHETLSAKV